MKIRDPIAAKAGLLLLCQAIPAQGFAVIAFLQRNRAELGVAVHSDLVLHRSKRLARGFLKRRDKLLPSSLQVAATDKYQSAIVVKTGHDVSSFDAQRTLQRIPSERSQACLELSLDGTAPLDTRPFGQESLQPWATGPND